MKLLQMVIETTEEASYCAIKGQVEKIQQLIEKCDDASLPDDVCQSLMTTLHNCLDLAIYQLEASTKK